MHLKDIVAPLLLRAIGDWNAYLTGGVPSMHEEGALADILVRACSLQL